MPHTWPTIAAMPASDGALPVPRIIGVLARRRPVSPVPRVFDGQARFGELIETPERAEKADDQLAVLVELGPAQVHEVLPGDALQLAEARHLDGAWGLPEGRWLHRGSSLPEHLRHDDGRQSRDGTDAQKFAARQMV
jgi:hypothetical protein